MPAVTVADTTQLERLPGVGPEAVRRPVRSVTVATGGLEGEGFPVRRAFAGVDLTDLDPFVHMDQISEIEYAPESPRARPGTPTVASRPSRT